MCLQAEKTWLTHSACVYSDEEWYREWNYHGPSCMDGHQTLKYEQWTLGLCASIQPIICVIVQCSSWCHMAIMYYFWGLEIFNRATYILQWDFFCLQFIFHPPHKSQIHDDTCSNKELVLQNYGTYVIMHSGCSVYETVFQNYSNGVQKCG